MKGHACEIDDVFKTRAVPQFLTAKRVSSKSWKDILPKSDVRIINIEAEQKDPGPGDDEARFVLVGLFPPKQTEKDLQTTITKRSVGNALPQTILRPDKEHPAFRVVTPITTKPQQGGIEYYVLMEIDHKTGLWYSNSISQEIVFFLPEYRSNATNQEIRKKDWSQKVTEVSVIESLQHDHSVKHTTYLGSNAEHQVARLHLELTKFTLTNNPESLESIKKLIDEKDSPKHELRSLLQLFLAMDGEFTEEHAKGLATEILKKWYQLATLVTADRLSTIHEAIYTYSMDIEFQYAYTFLVYSCTKLVKGNLISKRLQEMLLYLPKPFKTMVRISTSSFQNRRRLSYKTFL
jgi:hypothetical protein